MGNEENDKNCEEEEIAHHVKFELPFLFYTHFCSLSLSILIHYISSLTFIVFLFFMVLKKFRGIVKKNPMLERKKSIIST
jgi:hypothetical protein